MTQPLQVSAAEYISSASVFEPPNVQHVDVFADTGHPRHAARPRWASSSTATCYLMRTCRSRATSDVLADHHNACAWPPGRSLFHDEHASEQCGTPADSGPWLRLSTSGWNLIALQSGKGVASLEKPRNHPAADSPGRSADVAATSFVSSTCGDSMRPGPLWHRR